METMEHNDSEKCDCPACYLNAIYEEAYVKWEKLRAYITMDMPDREVVREEKIQEWLNARQKEGYELTAVHDGMMFMRSIPPPIISQRDLIMELFRRKRINEAEGGDFPTVGTMQ